MNNCEHMLTTVNQSVKRHLSNDHNVSPLVVIQMIVMVILSHVKASHTLLLLDYGPESHLRKNYVLILSFAKQFFSIKTNLIF